MHSLLKKLNFKEGQVIDICSTPPEFLPVFNAWENDYKIRILPNDNAKSFLLIFVYDRMDIHRIVETHLKNMDSNAVLWFAYPKMSSKKYKSDVTRDNGWEVMDSLDLRPVRQIAIDDDWSALRFRSTNKVKLRKA